MYVVTVTFGVKPSQIEDFMPKMLANARQSRAYEPGCLRFDVCRNAADPAQVFLYEIYKDRAAFEAHLASEHFQSFDQTVKTMILTKQVHTYDELTE